MPTNSTNSAPFCCLHAAETETTASTVLPLDVVLPQIEGEWSVRRYSSVGHEVDFVVAIDSVFTCTCEFCLTWKPHLVVDARESWVGSNEVVGGAHPNGVESPPPPPPPPPRLHCLVRLCGGLTSMPHGFISKMLMKVVQMEGVWCGFANSALGEVGHDWILELAEFELSPTLVEQE
ncbi:unnamed protein product [Hydatigera taeniaeformis]|uniref:Uncharacterized protein n=1 Tax=Hydatigena taeniaeformis TaxID=6205 RepID=A0A0R3WV10_HYDTA|nr:unnamed protein product [Hydatigera taeniaeformis]